MPSPPLPPEFTPAHVQGQLGDNNCLQAVLVHVQLCLLLVVTTTEYIQLVQAAAEVKGQALVLVALHATASKLQLHVPAATYWLQVVWLQL